MEGEKSGENMQEKVTGAKKQKTKKTKSNIKSPILMVKIKKNKMDLLN